MASEGFVYIITNQAMPGIVKVGRTAREPQLRAREMGGAGAPYPYQVRYAFRTKAHRAVEAAAHRILKPCRLTGEGGGVEWFSCTVRQARSAIERAARKVDRLFNSGSFAQCLVSAFWVCLRRVHVMLLAAAAAMVAGPVLWPMLMEGLGPAWEQMLIAPPASYPALAEGRSYAAGWLILCMVIMLARWRLRARRTTTGRTAVR